LSNDKKEAPKSLEDVLKNFAKEIVQAFDDMQGCSKDDMIHHIADMLDDFVNDDPFVMFYCDDCEKVANANEDREPMINEGYL